MQLKFKWQPGDVAAIQSNNKTDYYIITGTTELEPSKRYPKYLAQKFGESTNRRFTGYHTKAFKQSRRRIFEGELWFEGMQYLWTVKKKEPDSLDGAKQKAYEAALEDISEFQWENYYEAQIKFIFKEARAKSR